MKLRSLIIAFVLMAGSCFAADVDGKWTGTFSTPMGDIPIGFTFKADGATLTGTTTGPDGADIKISDGKTDGNKISFTVSLDFGGMPLTITYKGVVEKDTIKLTVEVMGMPTEMTVKKTV
jgi:hypothetical protein